MNDRAFRCGHPRSENNTLNWIDRSRNQLRAKCKRCQNRRNRERGYRRTENYRTQQRQRWAEGKRRQTVKPEQHGTVTGYNYGCRCEECTAAINTFHRVARLKRKAKKLGIVIPRELNAVRSNISLDYVAEASYGMDRVMIGSDQHLPTGDLAVGA